MNPHIAMVCDPLAMAFFKANLRALLDHITAGKLEDTSEQDELSHHKEVKELWRAAPRLGGRAAGQGGTSYGEA